MEFGSTGLTPATRPYSATFWDGTTGLTREAYYAGWEIIGQLLRGGMSFHEIATTPAVSFPALIAQAIASILGGGSH